jgi:hypothetical protein
MSEPVVVSVGTRHSWYLNAIRSVPDTPHDVREDRKTVQKWWRDRYGAYFSDNYELVFPNQERYLECVLTWS